MPEGQDQEIAKMIWADMKKQAQEIAEMRGLAPGNKKLTPDEELALFMREAPDWSPDKEAILLAEGKTREEVGLLKYPERERLAKSGGRIQPKDWIAWANQQAERQFKKSGQQPAEGTQPDGMV